VAFLFPIDKRIYFALMVESNLSLCVNLAVPVSAQKKANGYKTGTGKNG
jgi:hypothetical protein